MIVVVFLLSRRLRLTVRLMLQASAVSLAVLLL